MSESERGPRGTPPGPLGTPGAPSSKEMPRLAFIDYDRQNYSREATTTEPKYCKGEFSIGSYYPDGGVGTRGEFKITLLDLGRPNRELTPHLHVFRDGIESMRELLEKTPAEELLADALDHKAFSRRLLEAGVEDASDKPLDPEGAESVVS